MHVLAIGNQKGGVAKTTSAAALGVILSRRGKAVHLIDMDPQANLSEAFGVEDGEGLLFQALRQRGPLPVVRLSDTLTLTPSSIDLARAETEFLGEPGREYMLKTCLEKTELPGHVPANGDVVVIIDCPPSLAVLATNCLTATEALLVPMKAGGFELRAVGHLTDVVRLLKERVNPGLRIVGVVLTEAKKRRAITPQVIEEVGRLYPVLGVIPEDAELVYATTGGTTLKLKRSTALEEYRKVVDKLGEELAWLNVK
jgi:chromosome partitioning protein